jgi:hypothetical protein
MSNERSRYQRRTKKRKTNVILNSLIGVVLLLIIVVSATIFLGNDDEETAEQDVKATESQEETASEEETANEEEETTEEEPEEDMSNAETEPSSTTPSDTEEVETTEPGTDEDTEPVVTEGGTEPNVIRTLVNPSWKPIGTVQTGEHYNQYDGVDWDEMVDAIAYATGLTEDSMTVHFLGNNGHNKSVGTVYTKGKEDIYRVYIEWVDGQGWKPSKVEELSEVPEKKKKEENSEG